MDRANYLLGLVFPLIYTNQGQVHPQTPSIAANKRIRHLFPDIPLEPG